MRQLRTPSLAATFAAVVLLLSACDSLDESVGPSNSNLVSTSTDAFAKKNAAPRASISTPTNRTTVTRGVSVLFSGSGNDQEDGALTGASLVWTTNLNGTIGTGESFTRSDLAVGRHTVTLTGSDSQGATVKQSRILTIAPAANQPPVAAISSPASAASITQGTDVSFSGSGIDPEQGALTGAALAWSSSVSGQIGTGTSFSVSSLSAGTHTITLTAKDAGNLVSTASRSISIVAANAKPSVVFSSPAVNASYVQGVSVPFSGSASDAEDGVLSGAALVWQSDRDGQIGTGTSFTRSSLSVGQHQVSLTATDSRGAASVSTRAISITSSPVASVSVTLSATAAQVGASVTATAVLRSSSGVVLTGRVVAWSTSNGALASVNPTTGLVTALGAGTVNVIATSEDRTGQASLTISAVSTQPSPTGLNEPTGMTLITDRPFNCRTPVECEPDWNFIGSAFTIVTDPTAPRSASKVGQIKFPAGYSGGNAPAGVFPLSWGSAKKVLYVSAWHKFSSNFQNHPTGINKMIHFYINGGNKLVLIGRGNGLDASIALQGIAAPYSNTLGHTGTSIHLVPNVVPGARFVRGQWHRFELILVGNTPGVANGSVTLFLDGVKVLAYSGIMYAAAGGTGAWSGMNWSPTWGGSGGTVVADMYNWIDHISVSGKN